MKKYFFTFLGFLSILSVFSFSLFQGYIWFVYPDRGVYPLTGIDVSHHQGKIDWKAVKDANIAFAYLKATEWDDWVDKRFEENYIWARWVGIPVWVYHFYSLRIESEKQLENIIRTLSGKILDLPIAIDLEFWGNSRVRPDRIQFQKDLTSFLQKLEEHFGIKPVLYMTYEFREAYLGTSFDTYPIWIRDIFSFPETLSWTLWQYKNRGHVSGIDGFVDLNTLSGSLDDFSQKILK